MAQNIVLMGATYSDVPSVLLPKSGGGTASFVDVTDTTAAASDVASGKYFYTAAGVRTQGTSSGGGGSSKFIMGDFTTGSSTGTTASVTLPYTGSGYPIMALIVIAGGAYNNTESGNTTWYNSTQRYAIGQWTYSKSNMTTTPTYGTSGAANYGVTTAIYKNSTSTATTYTRTSAMNTLVLTSTAPTAAGSTCCRFSSKTVLNYFIAASSYGLMASTKYTYFIVYSS